MNKKEVAEIKRQIKFGNDDLLINKIGIYYINKENVVICSSIKHFTEENEMTAGMAEGNSWNQLDEVTFLEIFKKTLGGQLGKGLVEYAIPNDILLGTDNCYTKLNDVLDDNLETKETVDKYVSFLAEALNKDEEYAICLLSALYTLPVKDAKGFKTKDEDLMLESEEFNFLIVSICPVVPVKLGLLYDKNTNEIEHKPNEDKTIALPTSGFLFPAFNNRTTDINNILVFNKKSKEPDLALIRNALGCNFIMDADEEQNKFNTIITKVITGDDDLNVAIDYKITQSIYSIISEKISNSVLDTEMPTISKSELKSILSRSGVLETKLEKFDEVYDEVLDNQKIQFKAVNVINASKLDIKSPDVVINVKSDKSEKITAKQIDGKRCLVVELDENVEINGLNVKVQ